MSSKNAAYIAILNDNIARYQSDIALSQNKIADLNAQKNTFSDQMNRYDTIIQSEQANIVISQKSMDTLTALIVQLSS